MCRSELFVSGFWSSGPNGDPQMSEPSAPSDLQPARPEELPPVQPPSASYIIQLFLIPGLIVAAVIGVWLLFGRIASSETDWKMLLKELGSAKEERRWRAANGLADMLHNQQVSPPRKGEVHLAREPEVASGLVALLQQSLTNASPDMEELRQQEFLARTLGALDNDEIVLPALREAIREEYEDQVRESALMAVGAIANRRFQKLAQKMDRLEPDRVYPKGQEVITLKRPLAQATIDHEELYEELRDAIRGNSDAIRHLSVYALGMISGDAAISELKFLLDDSDPKTRANAAVGLARNGDTSGIQVLQELLEEFSQSIPRSEFAKLNEKEKKKLLERRSFEAPTVLGNCLRAVDSIWVALSKEEQENVLPVIKSIARSNSVEGIRVQALSVLNRIEKLD